MTAELSPAIGAVIGLVAVATVIGAVDLIRKPGWAWKAAGEPKVVCLLLVLFLPVVGLAIYAFGARPKVTAVATTGRAASLPFERFADRADLTADDDRAIGVLAMPTTLGSFGQPISRPLRATTATEAVPVPEVAPAVALQPTNAFFDDPDVLSVGAAARFFEGGHMTPPGPVAVEIVDDPPPPSDLRFPGGIGRPYNPRQRESLDEEPLTGEGSIAGTAALRGEVPGGGSSSTMAGGGAPGTTLAAPRVGTSSPEIFRPRPQTVAPIAGTAATATAPRAAVAARWMNDPTGRHQYRYWDGGQWTENVYDAGVESRDPVTD